MMTATGVREGALIVKVGLSKLGEGGADGDAAGECLAELTHAMAVSQRSSPAASEEEEEEATREVRVVVVDPWWSEV